MRKYDGEEVIILSWQENLDRWIKTNTFHHSRFSDIKRLVDLKEKKGLKISLGFPTLNEEETIEKEVKVMKDELQTNYPLIDEIAIIDSGSTDNTVKVAREAGAKVYLSSECLPRHGYLKGKGENLWNSLYLLEGDIILWIDADIKNIHPKFAYGILGPLLEFDEIVYVKAFYERPIKMGTNKLRRTGGGRVTEILVRPLLSNFYPELSGFFQPLSGEYAGRREILEKIPFRVGYGVETGLLIDIYEQCGLFSLAQVDLDRRIHRNRSLDDLGRMSFAILHTFFTRLQEQETISINRKIEDYFNLVRARGEEIFLVREKFSLIERKPMIEIGEYREKRRLLKEFKVT
ncbi:glucosyl-3-phosphoglycerate synthase [Candidatus Aerophobetes bacterium]|nr:glucosyl-3-phosphoglycerate synthase [Candidatus Aerophobetes bacterium]